MKKLATLLFLMFIGSQIQAQLVINEVLYDPSNNALDGDANGDGTYNQEEDTFIEIYNNTATNFDISGYQIWDDTTSAFAKFIFPANTFIPPNGVVVVFGAGPLVGNFGGALTFSNDTSSNGLNFNNSGEVIALRDASGTTVLTFDSDALSNNPNESYTRNPDVTGVFEQHNDNTPLLFSPGTRIDGTPFDTAYVAESLTVSAQGGSTTITTIGGTLQMEATVLPTFTTDTSVTWSVAAGNPIATISTSGLVTATGNGTLVVTATTNDGTNITATETITVNDPNMSINEVNSFALELFPNPAKDYIKVQSASPIEKLEVYDLRGGLLLQVENSTTLNLSNLRAGNYVLKAHSDGAVATKIFTVN